MTYNQQARDLMDELNLRGKLSTEHYSIIEAALDELETHAEKAEHKVKTLRKILENDCHYCKHCPTKSSKWCCQLGHKVQMTHAARRDRYCPHWQLDYDRFKEADNERDN